MELVFKSLRNFLYLFISTVFIIHPLRAQERPLKIEDPTSNTKLVARTAKGFNAMPDGEHYSNLEKNNQGQNIISYSFKSGKATDTLLEANDLRFNGSIINIESYSFSSNGKKILLSVDQEAIYRHSTKEEYYVYDLGTRTLSHITKNGKSMYGRFSPDGNQLAYVRENNLYLYNLNTNRESSVTTDGNKNAIINGATDWVYEEEFAMDIAFAWSPDGKKIAYYRFDESQVKEYNLTTYGDSYPQEERYKYPKAGENNSKVEIHIYDIAFQKDTRVFSTDPDWEYIPRMKWTSDSDVLSFQRMNRHQNVVELVFYSIKANSLQTILKEESNSYIPVTNDLTFLKDGKQFIWTSSKDGFNHIYLYQTNGKLIKQITSGPFEVSKFYGIDEKNQTCYYLSTEKSPLERQLYSITNSGKKKLLTPEKGTHKIEFSEGLKYYVDTYSSMGVPFYCSLHDNSGKFLRVLENNEVAKKELSSYTLGRMDTLSFRTEDGTLLYGWMLYPPDFNPAKKYPVLFYIYGGPGRQTVVDEWGGSFYLLHQFLAQKGYIIVSFDNRGTPGRGHQFESANYKNLGKFELQDQLSVARFLGSKSFIDTERMGVWGWSFGGYLTSLLMTKGNLTFKMGIAIAPVTNWKYYDNIYTERYLQTPSENLSGYEENSPVNFAKNLSGKLLLVHGSSDDNVHMQNTMDFVSALVNANKQFDLFIYPNKNHSIRGGSARLHLFTKIANYVTDNL